MATRVLDGVPSMTALALCSSCSLIATGDGTCGEVMVIVRGDGACEGVMVLGGDAWCL